MYTQWSMTDFIFSLFGSLVSWRSCLQPITVFSTIEVEYIGIMEAAKEALWLKGLALEMGLAQKAVGYTATVKVHRYLHKTLSTMREGFGN